MTRVLLAEDDADDKDLFLSFLSRRKDIVLMPVMDNGRELINFLLNSPDEQLPDLIVLDQNMPLMNGKQVLQFLQSHDRLSSIPTVVYSTYPDNDLIIDSQKLGARMVAAKPIDREGYHKMMDDFLTII